MKNKKAKMIGYGSFMKDVLEQMAQGLSPTTWGESVTLLGPVTISGFHRLWPGEFYPIVIPSETKSFLGLLLEVSETQIPRFDQIEGVPDLYERKSIEVKWQDSQTTAFLYVAGLKLQNMIFKSYLRQSRKPGFDDWLDHLRQTLSAAAKAILPEIFNQDQ
ncbi:MAG: gamma-glutamylcyclotransferase family protein [Candidatus Hodarchaeota archaeon]